MPKHLCDRFGIITNVEVEATPAEHSVPIRKRLAGEHPVDRVYGILNGGNVDEHLDKLSGR